MSAAPVAVPPKVNIPRSLSSVMSAWAPPEKLPMGEWCEKHFWLSSEYSAKTGLIRFEPGQREIFDAVSDPRVHQVTNMCAVQMHKTLLLQAAMAYTICEDPGPILFVGSKEDKAEEFSKDRFTPMCRDIEKLNALVSPAKSRDATNTTWHKMFPGGRIDFVGANVKDNLVGKTIRIVCGDEVDVWPASVGKSGDPLQLVRSRLTRFGSRAKLLLSCSPTIRGKSRIAAEYEASDQRKPYVKCHHCGHMQVLGWSTHVVFDTKLDRDACAAEARIKCESCEGLWTDADRRRNVRDSLEWRAHAEFRGHVGFWINHLYSTLPGHSIEKLVLKFLDVKNDREKLQVFINEDLGELWNEDGERPEWEKVRERAEDIQWGPNAVLHPDAIALFAGVDVQAKRLELQVIAVGPDDLGVLHTWAVDYQVIELQESDGTPKMTTDPAYWRELDVRRRTLYKHPSGKELPIIAMAVDAGHNADAVYNYAKKCPRPAWGAAGIEILQVGTVVVVRGYDSENYMAIHKITERETARQRKSEGKDIPIVTLGTGFLKTELYSGLQQTEEKIIHLPKDMAIDYFRGLTAETRIVTSKAKIEWEKKFARNEPLDTWVYAKGAFYCFKGDKFKRAEWNTVRQRFGLPPVGPVPTTPQGRRTVSSSYLDT
jgi:phage terminase large subunit GpA-like protein